MNIPKELWDHTTDQHIPTPENVKEFLTELIALYNKYNLSLSHEDHHGAFIIRL